MGTLFDAIAQGDALAFESCLRSGNSLEIRNSNHESALHAAIQHNQASMLERLLAAGSNPNVQDRHGQTPLHHAVRQHKAAMLSLLLAAKADPDRVDYEQNSPLYLAASLACAECAGLLVGAGAAGSLRGGTGWTAMIKGVCQRKTDVLLAMLKSGLSTEHTARNGWTPMLYAAWGGDAQSMGLLLEHGASLDARSSMSGWTALHCAAVAGHLGAVRWLVMHGVDPCIKDDLGWEARTYAELHQKVAVSQYLRSVGAASSPR